MKTRNLILNLFAIVLILATLSSCSQGINGNGKIVKQERETSTFSKLKIDGVFNVYLSQAETESVVVEADENLQEFIEVINDNNLLNVKFKEGTSIGKKSKMNIYITLKNVNEINFKGVGKLMCSTMIKVENMLLEMEGVGSSELKLTGQTLNVENAGVGSLTLSGNFADATINNEGIGNVNAAELIVQKMKVENSGVGNVEVRAESEIDINSSGVGNVYYSGNATVKSLKDNGIGKVKKN